MQAQSTLNNSTSANDYSGKCSSVIDFRIPELNNQIQPAVLQYRYLRFFENLGRTPPLEEVFFLMKVLEEARKAEGLGWYETGDRALGGSDLERRCPGAFVVAHYFAAATYLYKGADNAHTHRHLRAANRLLNEFGISKKEGKGANLSKSWPISDALKMYDRERKKLFPNLIIGDLAGVAADDVNANGENSNNEIKEVEGYVASPGLLSTPKAWDASRQWPELEVDKVTTLEILISHCRENLDWIVGPNLTIEASPKVEITVRIYDKCK